MLGIGFGVYYTIIIIRSPQNPILIIKAPTLEGSAVPFASSQSRILGFCCGVQWSAGCCVIYLVVISLFTALKDTSFNLA